MLLRRRMVGAIVLLAAVLSCPQLPADEILLLVEGGPPSGLVMGEIDLTEAVRWCKLGPVAPGDIRAWRLPDRAEAPVQFVPAVDFDPAGRVAGTILVRLPGGGNARLGLTFGPEQKSAQQPPPQQPGPQAAVTERPFDGRVATKSYRVVHDAAKMGGLPCRVEFVESGKVFERFRWNDRLHDRAAGSFGLADDPEPRVGRVSTGPLATVVRVHGRYGKPNAGESRPRAVYDWHYLNDSPLVWVTATAVQDPPRPWDESHFLELNFPGDDFTQWAGGEPAERGKFEGKTRSFHFNRWGALVEGRDAIAMLDCGQALFYDHRGGSYLQAHGDRAWRRWAEPRQRWSAWMWVGAADDLPATIRAAEAALPTAAHLRATVASVESAIESAREKWQAAEGPVRQQTWWHAAGAAQLAESGGLQAALDAAGGRKPDEWTILDAGDLGAIFAAENQGIALRSLFDTRTSRQLAASQATPLFELTLRHAETKEQLRLTADGGWREVRAVPQQDGRAVELRWAKPVDERVGPLEVVARATVDPANNSIGWQLTVAGAGSGWALWHVVFPQVAVAELGPESKLFVPRAAGQVEENAWRRTLRSAGRYPSGWMSMQYMAAYAGDGSTGLYAGIHDPFGGTKEIVAESRPDRREVVLSFDHPVPDMGKPGNRFELSGQGVWQLMRGDWYDAAVIYRRWVREHAKWYPERTADGRADTPSWMRELAVWAIGGGDPKSGLPVLQEFAEKMELPVGFHWYNWHEIPFDNDYPHYFPPDEGFADAVKLLQGKQIHVMPYINGRLWDTHDKGTEDFEFSKVALPAATKDEQGNPYIETYGSKETDGSKVELAAMCPNTPLWQETVRRTVLRLMNECGVHGVYIDQVAAAQPQLCFDASHGHPLGGGHWWTESYWRMLEAIRRDMPKDRMLTTECNAEPYVKWFDGYLTWHWQYDGQVPAFPAVYGGAFQMFGRAYRGGPTKDLALRMKAGQQLVFGEQIGWIDPGVVREAENFAFLREVVHLRWRLRRYFHAGEMGRPPRLGGTIPSVTADWQWHNVWPVTTPAAMTGAWLLPSEHRAVLLVVNVGDQPIETRLELDAAEYGITGETVRVTTLRGQGEGESCTLPRKLQKSLTLPPRSAAAWELTRP